MHCARQWQPAHINASLHQNPITGKDVRDPGIEPGSVPWQGTILPLNQPRRTDVASYFFSIAVADPRGHKPFSQRCDISTSVHMVHC